MPKAVPSNTIQITQEVAKTQQALHPTEPTLTVDTCLSRVLEVIPDVEPEHALSLLRPLFTAHRERAIELAMHNLFENPYPKVNKAKRKRADSDTESSASRKVKIDYASKDRPFSGSPYYRALAMV
jgi:TRIAD3 protein (E3 ubiquitin-protein ligase RNF216)